MSIRNNTISVVIPTFNCKKELKRCLKSVQWANEIIVVDMGSTDGTISVAKRFKAKIFTRFPTGGNFDQNRKFAMEKAAGNWLLKIDSDEVLSANLQKEIISMLQTENQKYDGFNLYNRIFMLGKQIRHGFIKKGSHELRLVRNGKWSYDPYRFHQLITVDGKIGYLRSFYDHYNTHSVSEFIGKMNKYTDIDAKYYRNKISIFDVLSAPLKSFLKLYFWQLGFLDGKAGYIICNLFAIYNLIEKIKVWEFQNI